MAQAATSPAAACRRRLDSFNLGSRCSSATSRIRRIDFGRQRSAGERKPGAPPAVPDEDNLKRIMRLVILLLEVATILEEAVNDLHPLKTAERADNRQ
ncbi:hypothetical protein XH98_26130 [Bradyrhizobium sp. CCBAU 51745]|uniref:hypothetical protein n=1 Tax=Bradyrhizobium sp. CCBAU 51745 TaxID=1325099 RepID=UPI002305E0AF|nr:hypothetical protein [Bradyrhizobium sp. CCBAU 51745]MDA9442516.1 hypothetical protein [Bradyrhizobium sp. CCBAU 51745]